VILNEGILKKMGFNQILKNQVGASLVMIIILVSVSLAGVGYVITNVIPQLNDAAQKSKIALDYKIFISSFNDYIVHGIREKWCIENLGTVNAQFKDSPTVMNTAMLSNFLVSTDCSGTATMESIVVNEANLERILWNETTIGNPSNLSSIMGLNTQRVIDTLTTTTLNPDDIKVSTLRFRITNSILNDIGTLHPLYLIANSVKGCIENVDVLIEKENDLSNAPVGDEVKFSIRIMVELKNGLLNSKCSAMRIVESKAFYSFIPRRNHMFSLIKYGDLNTNIFANYYGPVYVAGDLRLDQSAVKEKTSLFLGTVTLGVFDNGDSVNNYRKSGRLRYTDDSLYTYEDRGHPFLGKQDNYDSFRGLLGGLRLDAQEDKGMSKIFDYTASSGANIADLELCVSEQSYLTTPSKNNSSLFYYYTTTPSTSQSSSFELGFTERNRFKESDIAPVIAGSGNNGNGNANGNNGNGNGNGNNGNNGNGNATPPDTFFELVNLENVNPDNSVEANPKVDMDFTAEVHLAETYEATLGKSSSIELKVNLPKFGFDPARALVIKNKLDSTHAEYKVNKDDYLTIFDEIDGFKSLAGVTPFEDAMAVFMANCVVAGNQLAICETYGYASGDTCAAGSCTGSTYDADDLEIKLTNIKNKVTELEGFLSPAEEAFIKFKFNPQVNTGPLNVHNKHDLNITLSTKLQNMLEYIDIQTSVFTFKPRHFGDKNYEFKLELVQNSTDKSKFDIKQGTTVEVPEPIVYESIIASKYIDTTPPAPGNEITGFDFNTTDEIEDVVDLVCPEGIGMASWGLDMSGSTNFAWNYANTPPGVVIENASHDPAEPIQFAANPTDSSAGYGQNLTMSIVESCSVASGRKNVYGFYACETLIIESGRTEDLNMIGTFIVKNLVVQEQSKRINWYSIWNETAANLIMTDLKSTEGCAGFSNVTWKDIETNPWVKVKVEQQCSSQALVEAGPNNFTWTTVDPDIGIANPGDSMTSQKVKRFQNFIINEISRVDNVK